MSFLLNITRRKDNFLSNILRDKKDELKELQHRELLESLNRIQASLATLPRVAASAGGSCE